VPWVEVKAKKRAPNPQISAEVLKKMKKTAEALGEKVQRRFINRTLPNFNDSQRKQQKTRVKIAGLEVNVLSTTATAKRLWAYGLR